MADQLFERRLAAIVAADVVGYSRLMSSDETGTLTRLKTLRRTLIEPMIARYNGRIVKLMGDGVLIEFPSVVDAAACSVQTQRELISHNQTLAEAQRIEFRIGINLGDIIVEGDDIYGDGVNIAARLEHLAEPNGICLSQAARDALGSKLPLGYDDMGARTLKNIAEPVRVYRVYVRPDAVMPEGSSAGQEAGTGHGKRSAPSWRWAATAVVILSLGAGGVTFWQQQQTERADAAKTINGLPDKPSIAVLPFKNLNKNEEPDYFVEGMTDDLITDLSKLSGIFVIARNTVFEYRRESANLQKIAGDLGVRYLLKGSVRRAEGRVRINAQLIDAETGTNVWAERYDGDYKAVFALQDQVVGNIVASLRVTLSDAEQDRLERIPTTNMEAYDYYLRGRRSMWARTAPGRRDALMLLQKAIALDREFADAYAAVARVASTIWRIGESTVLPHAIARELAYGAAGKSLAIDPQNSQAYSVLGYLQVTDGQHDEALRSVEKAVSLRPGNAEAYADKANILIFAGRPEEAVSAMRTAIKLEPNPPPIFFHDLGRALFANRQYESAVEYLEKARDGGVEQLEPLAKTYARLSRAEEAKATIDALLGLLPGASLADYRASESALYRRSEDLKHSIESLRMAGLTEWPFGYAANIDDRLENRDIEKILFGKTWQGSDTVNGGEFIQKTDRDGKTAFRSGYSLLTGKVWVEDDRLCFHFPTYGKRHKNCAYLFKKSSKGSNGQDEYVLLGKNQILQFTLTAAR